MAGSNDKNYWKISTAFLAILCSVLLAIGGASYISMSDTVRKINADVTAYDKAARDRDNSLEKRIALMEANYPYLKEKVDEINKKLDEVLKYAKP